MSYLPTVAIIDEGISNCLMHKLAFNLVVKANGEVDDYKLSTKRYGHGEICFLLLKKHLPWARIGSIAMEEFSINSLIYALEWCLTNNINFIQLSIGVIHPSYPEEIELRDVIERLFLNGCVIVASLSNTYQYTVPACLPHVFGVRSKSASESYDITYLDKSILGINFEATENSMVRADHSNILINNRSNSYSVPKVMAHLVNASDSTLNEYQRKQFELVHPYTSKNYVYIRQDVNAKQLLPSIINVTQSITPNSIPLHTTYENLVIDKDLYTHDDEISEILYTFRPKYCIFLDKVSQSIRNACSSKRIFYWDPQNYMDAFHTLISGQSLLKYINVTCPIIYLSSTKNFLFVSNCFHDYITAKGYSCRFISIEKDYFLPGYDYCPDLNSITSFVKTILLFFSPSIIFILGSQKLLRTNKSVTDLIDIEINIGEDNSFTKSDYGNYWTVSVSPHLDTLELNTLFSYMHRILTL